MLKIFLITLFLASSAFAQSNVEVLVDGQRYYCSQDPNGTNNNSNCINASKKLSQQFQACKDANQTGSYCFQSSYQKVSAEDKACAEVAAVCNDICKNANQTGNYCYQTCY